MSRTFFTLSSTHRLLLEVFTSRPSWKIAIVISSLFSTFFGLLGPFFQKEFIDHLADPQSHLLFLFYAFLSLFFSLGFTVLTNFLGMREALIMQRKLAQRLYDHTLSLRTDTLAGRPIGDVVSLYATDVPGSTVFLEQSLPVGAGILFPLILAPWALAAYFEIPLWPLVTTMILVTILNFLMAFRQSKFFLRFKRLAAERIGLVSEWIQNIRALRILGWTEAYERKIFHVRQIETLNRIHMVTNGQVMNSINSSVTFLLNLIALVSLVFLSGKPVTSGTLLALLWIVGVFLTRPFRQLPWFFTFVFDSWTSLQRIDNFLSLQNQNSEERNSDYLKLLPSPNSEPALQIRNLSLSIKGRALLRSISLDIKNGEFVTIVGEVGSGKSLLLLSLLGETGASFEKYLVHGNNGQKLPLDQLRQFFTFVPQEGFIMSSTLRENVAFDYGVASDRDQDILASLENAQFRLSTERVGDGLDTEIGERGVNLSGGQKQRVSLARIDHYRSPIVLLDDCLSAVDVDTENKLIDGLIRGAWKDRTRLLVTHRLTVLEKSDRVIFLKNGALYAQGTFHELLANNSEFREFASTVAFDDSTRSLASPSPSQDATPAQLSGEDLPVLSPDTREGE